MKINVDHFEPGAGIVFHIKADNDLEVAILAACVSGKGTFEEGVQEDQFEFVIPVSN